MLDKLPFTPAETVKISASLKSELDTVIKLANTYKFWDRPYKEGATTFEEMGPLDIFYWVYKSANPIAQMEEGVKGLLATDSSKLKLPYHFEMQKSVTMGAAGDILHVQAKGLEYNSDDLYGSIADLLFEQDISFANYESPITTQALREEVIGDQGAPIECASRDQFNNLKGYKGKNFTALNFSNNHTFDMRVEGIDTTHKVFAEEGIVNIGTNKTPDEYGRAKIVEKNGLKIGFVSATFGMNGHEIPESERYRIHISRLCSKLVEPELDLVKKQIDDCKNKNCDFIIASLHWGWEFELFPRKSQMKAARELIEYGADSIIGHHPHVIQPIEYYQTRRDPNRVAVIAYSLGSLTWGFSAPYIALSIILNMTFAQGRFQGKEVTYIQNAKVTPIFRSCININGKLVTKIEKLADHLNGQNRLHSQEYISDIKRYVDLVLGDQCDLQDEKVKRKVA
jgi:poly-gamma-glutamate capsule biosynthesis protein CapA/YwtB (metallophosphatase superfamily)